MYGKIVNIEKLQDRLRAKGLFSQDFKKMWVKTRLRWFCSLVVVMAKRNPACLRQLSRNQQVSDKGGAGGAAGGDHLPSRCKNGPSVLPLYFSSTFSDFLAAVLLSPVRPLHPADGAAAVAALLRHGGGVCPASPPPAGGSVHQANGADAGEGRQGRGL